MRSGFAFILLFILSGSQTYGQKQGNIWYFGDGYGLDFNTAPPTLLNDGETAPILACGDAVVEGTASIADSSGSLLFYTDGQTIWNKNHEPMSNGAGLLGGTSSTQAALIVPKPQSDTRYYVFTTDDFCNDLANGLRYSVVDICLDSGYGAVVGKSKNILLVDTVAEKLAAVRHANGVDYWILVHKYFSNEFYAFRLTPQGIEEAVISSVGAVHEGAGANNMTRAIGQMKISSDGSRIALGAINGSDIFEVLDFDNSSGIVSNAIHISTLIGVYGVAFSPDGTKLYQTPLLTQYDLNAGGGNPASILASAFQYSNPNLSAFDGAELGPDGKIYLYDSDNTISVIHNPNAYGVNSGAEAQVYTMSISTRVYGFSSMIAGYDYTATGICNPIGIAEVSPSKLATYPNPANTSTTLTLPVPGTYNIMVLDAMGRMVYQEGFDSAQPGSSFNLSTANWPHGIYAITATNKEGVRYTSKLVVGR
jgi:hypothetical protein